MSRLWYEFEGELVCELRFHRNIMSFDSDEGRMVSIPWPVDYYRRQLLPVEEVVRLVSQGKIKVFCFHEGVQADISLRDGQYHVGCGCSEIYKCLFVLNLNRVRDNAPSLIMYYPNPSSFERNEVALVNEPRDSLDEDLNKERRLRQAASASKHTVSGSSNKGAEKDSVSALVPRSRKRERSSSVEGLGESTKRRVIDVSEDEGSSDVEGGSDSDEHSRVE
ncbi:hypothetical protein VNI00_016270 [Paramarasmius palmivorus]|uniref:Uncharacterized protein n=1 Tax=Paramarasmius palmivorus TaxID=297713 RepID=A0AAW0BDP9_9AGAR